MDERSEKAQSSGERKREIATFKEDAESVQEREREIGERKMRDARTRDLSDRTSFDVYISDSRFEDSECTLKIVEPMIMS